MKNVPSPAATGKPTPTPPVPPYIIHRAALAVAADRAQRRQLVKPTGAGRRGPWWW